MTVPSQWMKAVVAGTLEYELSAERPADGASKKRKRATAGKAAPKAKKKSRRKRLGELSSDEDDSDDADFHA